VRRSALSVFFQRIIVASLPLAAACQDGATAPPDGQAPQDLAVVIPTDAAMLPSPDLYDSCDVVYPVTRVNIDPSHLPDGGFRTECLVGSPCAPICPSGYMMCCAPTPSDGGAVIVDCSRPCPGGGRRPAGLAEASVEGACSLGSYFASMAHLEAASVVAFRRLERELRHHHAPARLVGAARRALRDEVRHARIMKSFAAQHGCTPAPVCVPRFAARPLEAIARENAEEGCVRETFGALVASWQARTAGDRSFAVAMSRIAADETRHAELSWSVDAFLRPKLSAAANRRVRRARQAVVDQMAGELEREPPAKLVARLGLPDRARARAFFDSINRALWS
jgi:hypothetical protein